MASSKWKNWDELAALTACRRVVFWGASNWVERSLATRPLPGAYVVDNNPNNQGITYAGFTVHPPKKLLEEIRNDIYVVICTVNYQSVIDELHEMGFVMGDEFCCTPLLSYRRSKDELKTVKQTVLVTSPHHAFSETHGGGIYEIATESGKIKKRYTGKCRGICLAGDAVIVIDMLRGLVILDDAFIDRDCLHLQENAEPHGLFYEPASNRLYVGQPGRDSVAVYSLDERKQVDEIFLSSKRLRSKCDNHHVNDICVHEGSLFVSMFSLTGNWMNDAYDGGVVEIDLRTREIIGAVASDLWMPHSVCRFDGRLCYLDSMRGILFSSTWNRVGTFNAYVRGLDFDGRYYYVGASEHRYPEKLKGISDNISLDAGFYLFDPESKMSRFFKMDEVESVHSLVVTDPPRSAEPNS